MTHPRRTRPWLPDLLAWALVALAATVPFWVTDLDLRAAASFFRTSRESGDWPQEDRTLWQLFYHGIPIATAVLSLAALGVLSLAAFRPPIGRWRPHAAMFLLTIVLGPGLLVNGIFKDNWGRPRPRQTLELGGDHPYQPPLRPELGGKGKSFPCGHCSVGFSLVAGWFLLRPSALWWARGVLLLAVAAGMLIGMGRMAAGAHFLSDVLWAGLLTYLGAWVAYFFVLRIPRWRQRLKQAPPRVSRHPWLEGGAYAVLAVALLGGSLVATPMELNVRLSQPLDALPVGTRSLTIEAGRADLDLLLVGTESAQVEAGGRLRGFGLPTNHLEARFDLPSAQDPRLGLHIVTRGYYKELSGQITVMLPAGAFDTIEARVEQGDLRWRRTDPASPLPELHLAAPRGTVESL